MAPTSCSSRRTSNRGRPASRASGSITAWISILASSTATSTTCRRRSEEHTSELQSLMRISYAVFCLKKKNSIRHHFLLHLRCSSTLEPEHRNDPVTAVPGHAHVKL